MKVLSFDPSGNYEEGKGTSGFAWGHIDFLPAKLGDVRAEDYASRQDYWFAHKVLIETTMPDVCVIESYRLFGHKSKEQIGSSLETPMLIGYLEMVCWEYNIPVVIQDPTTKSRHKDDILVKSGVVERKGQKYFYKGEMTNLHQRDAMRHYLYFKRQQKLRSVK